MEQKYTSLPCIFGMVTADCSYEGENTVLMLKIARWLGSPPSTSYSKNVFFSGTWWKPISMGKRQRVKNFTPSTPILTTLSPAISATTSPTLSPTISTKQDRRMPAVANLMLQLLLMTVQATTNWHKRTTWVDLTVCCWKGQKSCHSIEDKLLGSLQYFAVAGRNEDVGTLRCMVQLLRWVVAQLLQEFPLNCINDVLVIYCCETGLLGWGKFIN